MLDPDRPVTRYAGGKLYLLGVCAERLRRLALEALAGTVAGTFYDGEQGAQAMLFQMRNLAGGVLPWRVCEQINAAYLDVCAASTDAAGVDDRTIVAEAKRVLALLAALEESIVPDWDRRAKVVTE